MMEKIVLPLTKYSHAQKLELLETIWADLAGDEERFESPDWHEFVLKDREKALKNGKVKISEWGEAKERIKRNVT